MNRKLLFSLLILQVSSLLLCNESLAQFNSVLGRFSVDVNRGCSDLLVTITENGSFEGPQYWYENYDENVAGSTNLFFNYQNGGDFYLTLLVNDDDLPDGKRDSLLINIFEPEIPDFVIHNCDGHTVRVEITEDYYDIYQVDFTATDSAFVDPLSFSDEFDFGVLDSYRIDVRGQFEDAVDNCGADNKVVTTVDQIIYPVLNSVETTDNGELGALQLVHILDTLGDNLIYNLQVSTDNSNNFSFLNNISGAESTLDSIDTRNAFYCYQIDTYDACNEVSILSDTVCSVTFDVQSSENGNLISWQTDETLVQSYNILRNDGLLTNLEDATATSYEDTAVICNKQYIYNVQPIFNSGRSNGLDTAVIADKSGNLPPIRSYPSSTVVRNEVELDWGPPDTSEIPFNMYIIEKNINDRGWRTAGTTVDTTFTDQNASFIGSHSYRITYNDECENLASGSPSTDPIIIEQISARGKIVTYRWTRYETWLQGIRNYTIERVDTAGNVVEEYPVLSGREKTIEFSANDLVDKFIRIRAESLDDIALFSYSNIIETSIETEMYLPTAFTPDADNLNDRFFAKGPAVFNFRMEIYNRWGILIFSTTNNISGWDGMINGDDSPEGTYIYKIFFEDGEGRSFDQSGAFTLMRKGSQ